MIRGFHVFPIADVIRRYLKLRDQIDDEDAVRPTTYAQGRKWLVKESNNEGSSGNDIFSAMKKIWLF